MDLYAQQVRNRRLTWLLFIGFALLLGAVGLVADAALGTGGTFWLGGRAWPLPLFTALAVASATLAASGTYLAGDRVVLATMRARPLDPARPAERMLGNVVEEVAIAAGLPAPAAFVAPEPAPNALATGRSPERASIVVTEGLLGAMTRAELAAVVAHEMGHVRNADIRLMTTVAVLLGSIALLCDVLLRARVLGTGDRRRRGTFAALAVIAAVVAPLIARLMALALSRTREFEADRTAAELTRDPLALARALAKLGANEVPVRRGGPQVAPLFIVAPRLRGDTARRDVFRLFATHPPLAERIARLEAMGYARAERREDVAPAHP